MSAAENLARVIAERDALARHIEQLIARVTEDEIAVAWVVFNRTGMQRDVLELFIAERQRKGQSAALS